MAQNFGLSHITYLIIYFVGGGEAGLGLALLVHHELGEVPLDGVHQESSLFGLKCALLNVIFLNKENSLHSGGMASPPRPQCRGPDLQIGCKGSP